MNHPQNRPRGRGRATAGRARVLVRWAHAGVAAVCTGLALTVALAGMGPVPALGALLNPTTGLWSGVRAADVELNATIRVPGLEEETLVGFDDRGMLSVQARTDDDMFTALGYAQGTFRLFEMDILRHHASGRLASMVGPSAVESDKFELDVGLRRAAERDWRLLRAGDSPGKRALLAFTDGVNAAIQQLKEQRKLPMYYALLQLKPEVWTPVDSLTIQRFETQILSLDNSALSYTYIQEALGPQRFARWFGDVAKNRQYPFDLGPYEKLPLDPMPTPDPAAVQVDDDGESTATSDDASWDRTPQQYREGVLAAAGQILTRTEPLRESLHTIGNSNQWVVDGSRTESGKPLIASDPHLKMTLPSIWMEYSAMSPSYNMTGVGLPGIPVVLLGFSDVASWSITNSQHATTLYYLERTSEKRPDQFFYKGAWRPMNKLRHRIEVKGAPDVNHEVRLTAHGPVMTLRGITASMWWPGVMPSDNLNAALAMTRARSFDAFREALGLWKTPAENFAYADVHGDIGIINAGVAPQVAQGDPALPLPGDGSADVIGTVPTEALPVVHNPPGGVASSSNQREVTTDYPYYWGRGHAFFDQGWRQQTINGFLEGHGKISVEESRQLQLSTADGLAASLLPTVSRALRDADLTPLEDAAARVLMEWDGRIDKDGAAGTLWEMFVPALDEQVWARIAESYQVREGAPFPRKTAQGIGVQDAIRGMVVELAASNPDHPFFNPPGAPRTSADELIRQAFSQTVRQVVSDRGPDLSQWDYGRKHKVMMSSLLDDSTLDSAIYPYGSGGRSVNAVLSPAPKRYGKELTGVHVAGASWRFIVDWGADHRESSLPGGLSENPASPWYDNRVEEWVRGEYSPLPAQADELDTKGRTWTLIP